MRLLFLSIALVLTACAPSSDSVVKNKMPVSANFITKGPLALTGWGESSPFVFNNELFYMNYNPSGALWIRKANGTGTLINIPIDLKYPSIFVHSGVAYIYGSNNTFKIDMISSNDLLNWSAPITVIIPDTDATVYNTSVSVDSSGFIMTYEKSGGIDGGNFNAFFARSNDLINWTKVSGRYKEGQYTAAGTVRYISGTYYLFYLQLQRGSDYDGSPRNFYMTRVARSNDLLNWKDSPIVMLSPFDGGDPDSRNASDVDLIEYGGQVVMLYTNTSQDGILPEDNTMTGYRLATFDGTLAEMMERFYE